MRKNLYSEDRNDSDEFFYNSGRDEVKTKLEESGLYGTEIPELKPASKYDDEVKVTDTWIAETPIQVRVQFIENKKNTDYYPTLRYERDHGYKKTEVEKLIKMYKNEQIPHLIWMMVDRNENVLIKLIIVNLEKIISKREAKLELNINYRLTDDYLEKKNIDGQTSFLVLDNTEDYLYSYAREN